MLADSGAGQGPRGHGWDSRPLLWISARHIGEGGTPCQQCWARGSLWCPLTVLLHPGHGGTFSVEPVHSPAQDTSLFALNVTARSREATGASETPGLLSCPVAPEMQALCLLAGILPVKVTAEL